MNYCGPATSRKAKEKNQGRRTLLLQQTERETGLPWSLRPQNWLEVSWLDCCFYVRHIAEEMCVKFCIFWCLVSPSLRLGDESVPSHPGTEMNEFLWASLKFRAVKQNPKEENDDFH